MRLYDVLGADGEAIKLALYLHCGIVCDLQYVGTTVCPWVDENP